MVSSRESHPPSALRPPNSIAVVGPAGAFPGPGACSLAPMHRRWHIGRTASGAVRDAEGRSQAPGQGAEDEGVGGEAQCWADLVLQQEVAGSGADKRDRKPTDSHRAVLTKVMHDHLHGLAMESTFVVKVSGQTLGENLAEEHMWLGSSGCSGAAPPWGSGRTLVATFEGLSLQRPDDVRAHTSGAPRRQRRGGLGRGDLPGFSKRIGETEPVLLRFSPKNRCRAKGIRPPLRKACPSATPMPWPEVSL